MRDRARPRGNRCPAIDAYITQRRADGVTSNTIHKELGALRLVLKGVRRAGNWFGDVSSVMPVNFSPEYQPKQRGLTLDEVQRVMRELPRERAAWVALAAGSGAERGDLDLTCKV